MPAWAQEEFTEGQPKARKPILKRLEELESRTKLLEAENQSLKNKLTQSRQENQALNALIQELTAKTQSHAEMLKVVQEQLKELMPMEPDIWQACWNKVPGWFDFTHEVWTKLSHPKQCEYAKAYQRWYAGQKGMPVEKTFIAGGATFEMRLIPPGRFYMGEPERRHRVLISKPFWLQMTEITQKQWRTVTGETPWSGVEYMENNDDWAASHISWDDIMQKFLPKLGGSFTLPTEAQWEYACRAGTLGRWYWGESVQEMGKYANVADRAGQKKFVDWGNDIIDTEDGFPVIAPVGRLQPNAFGLHDMIGNVWEWCYDGYTDNPDGELDPKVSQGVERVVRGCSWYNSRFPSAALRGKDGANCRGRTGARLSWPEVD